MTKRFTEKQLKQFQKEYDRLIREAYSEIVTTGRLQLGVIKEHEGKCLIDMVEFARESFWHHLKKYADENYQMEAAVQEAKKIIESGFE